MTHQGNSSSLTPCNKCKESSQLYALYAMWPLPSP